MSTVEPVEELISFAQDEDTTPSNSATATSDFGVDVPSSIPLANPAELSKMTTPKPSRASMKPHTRSYSWVAQSANSKSFPITIVPPNYNYLRMPQSASTASPLSPFSPAISNLESIEPSNDPEQFLTVLASQERRVMELREEMTKADAELEKLKRKWALHEATKKRSESHTQSHSRQLRKSEDMTASIAEARRRSAGPGQIGTRRTTFSTNTRHQRTLSLLSPDRNNFHSFPQPADIWENVKSPVEPIDTATRARPMNMFESGYERSTYGDLDKRKAMNGHQEALIATGKQMAEDFKEGLWTFIEDLRQATVGEDGVAGHETPKAAPSGSGTPTPIKKKGSKSALKNSNAPSTAKSSPKPKPTRKNTTKATKLIDIGDDFWNELDPTGPLSTSNPADDKPDAFAEELRSIRKSHVRPESVRWSTSTIVSDIASGAMSPDTNISTPRTSTSISGSRPSSPIYRKDSFTQADSQKSTKDLLTSLADSQQQNVSWGAMVTPLKRTATAILSQVEKSLAPPIADARMSGFDLSKSNIQVNYTSAKSKHH